MSGAAAGFPRDEKSIADDILSNAEYFPKTSISRLIRLMVVLLTVISTKFYMIRLQLVKHHFRFRVTMRYSLKGKAAMSNASNRGL